MSSDIQVTNIQRAIIHHGYAATLGQIRSFFSDHLHEEILDAELLSIIRRMAASDLVQFEIQPAHGLREGQGVYRLKGPGGGRAKQIPPSALPNIS